MSILGPVRIDLGDGVSLIDQLDSYAHPREGNPSGSAWWEGREEEGGFLRGRFRG